MAQNFLRLVENKAVDKSKALDAALSQIERAFAKGSIMRLGANEQVAERSKGGRVEKYKATRPDGTEVTVTHNIDTDETSVSEK